MFHETENEVVNWRDCECEAIEFVHIRIDRHTTFPISIGTHDDALYDAI